MRHVKILLAAAITVGGMSVLPANAETSKAIAAPTALPSQSHLTASSVGTPAQPSLMQQKEPIRKTIADLTSIALTPGGMSKLVALFPEVQRKHIEQSSTYSQNFGDKLDSEIHAICKTWKQKYGHDLASFNGTEAIDSEVFPINLHNAATSAQSASASVSVSDSHGIASLNAKFLCESPSNWKIDVPATMTAQTLRDNLTSQLTAFEKQSAQWPAKQSDTYRSLTRHVLMAVVDQRPASMKPSETPSAQKTVTANLPKGATVTKTSTSTHHWWQFWSW